MGIKELSVEDIFLEIVKHSHGGLKEICSLYGINEKLTIFHKKNTGWHVLGTLAYARNSNCVDAKIA